MEEIRRNRMDLIKQLAEELKIQPKQAEAAVQLIDEGNTIPFIARYRKEATGALNDEVLRNLFERLEYLRNLEEKKQQVLGSIEEQGKLTEELKSQILAASTMVVVEDLYRPYRPKRRTRATIAKEKGLEPLALRIFSQELDKTAKEEAEEFISEEKGVADQEEALSGAKDILAEIISDSAEYRIYLRKLTMEEGSITSSARDKETESVYEMYYDFSEKLTKTAGHRILALNRGENEKFLTVKITAPVEKILAWMERQVITKPNPYTTEILKEVIADSYQRLIAPAIEREIRNELTEKAEDGAIRVFGQNLTQLLMQPPIEGQVVLGWDPGFRTGCKLAVVDPTGKVLDTAVVMATAGSEAALKKAEQTVTALIRNYQVNLISVGNGTASRESEQFLVELIKKEQLPVQYVIVSEAGASVYSASKLATEEFPEYDVAQRSAVSIARRLQDPLAELVKIEPKAIGVGQYQHDMNQKKLTEALTGVVEDCVNRVGVDLNTASASLLEYISGISKPIAKNIVAYREENGKYKNRSELRKVPKLGPKAFEQCAGFLRIHDGENPLDETSVHPESYQAAKQLLSRLGFTTADIKTLQRSQKEQITQETPQNQKQKNIPLKKQAADPKIQLKHSNTAMGQALFAAISADSSKTEKMGKEISKNSGNENQETLERKELSQQQPKLSGLRSMIPDKKKLAAELGLGEMTLNDIIRELEKPGRDPREEMPKPILRTDVLDLKDLAEGMILKGTVRNVIDFGAFVDIGVHQDGLVHISQLSKGKYIKHPLDVVSVGDIVEVKVLSVDIPKKRIALSMIL